MESSASSVSSKDSKRSLIWSHFTQSSDNRNMIRSVCNHCKKEQKPQQCGAIKTIEFIYWWLLRPTITIRFDSKYQIIAQLFDSIWNEKTLFAQHYTQSMPIVNSVQCSFTQHLNCAKYISKNCSLQRTAKAEHLVHRCVAHDQARRDIWLAGLFNTDPRRLWEFLERIGAVTRPPDREWERERERKRERESKSLKTICSPSLISLP